MWFLRVQGFFTPAGSGEKWFASAALSTLFSHSSPNARSCSNPSWKWQTYDTVWPDPVGGRVEFPMGADASRKKYFFKPGVFSWLACVSDKWITSSGLYTISPVSSSNFSCFLLCVFLFWFHRGHGGFGLWKESFPHKERMKVGGFLP